MKTIKSMGKKEIERPLIFIIIIFSFTFSSFGQSEEESCSASFSIPEIALIDIEPAGISNISLTLTTNPESGLPVTAKGASNNDLWINYTSSLATGNNNRSVTVQVSSGSIPDGVSVSLIPSKFSGKGKGKIGTPTGPVNLSSKPQTLISGIGRCYTGNGQNNGHRLNYSLSITDYNSLRYNESSTIQIAFTLTDN